MKLTKKQLKEIIREEIQQLNESDLTTYAIAFISGVITPWIGIGIGYSISHLRSEYGSVANGLVSVAKNMWEDYKNDKKLKEIVLKLKGDEELKPFLKDPKRRGIRKVLAAKLSEDEMKYLNKITRAHLSQVKENIREELSKLNENKSTPTDIVDALNNLPFSGSATLRNGEVHYYLDDRNAHKEAVTVKKVAKSMGWKLSEDNDDILVFK